MDALIVLVVAMKGAHANEDCGRHHGEGRV